MKKILILAYNFPPNYSVGSQRPSSWHTYFSKFGLEPTVICYDWRTGEHEKLEKNVIPVKCKRSELSSASLSGVQKIWRKAHTLFNLLFRFYSAKSDDKFELFEAADSFLREHPTDYILATGEPFILFKYASELSRKHDIPWYADYRDDWIDRHMPLVPNRFLNALIRKIETRAEQKYLKNVSGITTVSETLLEQLKKRLPSKRGLVVENGADVELYKNTTSPYPEDTFVIAYTGMLYDLPYFDLFFDGFIDFMNRAPKGLNCKVYFIGTEGNRNQATSKLDELKALYPENILLLPRKSPVEIAAYQNHAHVLLNLIAGDPSKGLIGAKSYNYAITKNPILTLPHIPSRTSSFFPGRDIQHIALHPKEISDFLLKHAESLTQGNILNSSISPPEIHQLSRSYNAEKLVNFITCSSL